MGRFAVIIGMLLVIGACGGSSDLKVNAHLKAVVTSQVGGRDGFDITIQNQDTDIQDLELFMANGPDNWLDHHVILGSGNCHIYKPLSALRCGALKAGKSMVVTVVSSPKDAGNFDYAIGIGDDQGGNMRQWKHEEKYSEAVTPR